MEENKREEEENTTSRDAKSTVTKQHQTIAWRVSNSLELSRDTVEFPRQLIAFASSSLLFSPVIFPALLVACLLSAPLAVRISLTNTMPRSHARCLAHASGALLARRSAVRRAFCQALLLHSSPPPSTKLAGVRQLRDALAPVSFLPFALLPFLLLASFFHLPPILVARLPPSLLRPSRSLVPFPFSYLSPFVRPLSPHVRLPSSPL